MEPAYRNLALLLDLKAKRSMKAAQAHGEGRKALITGITGQDGQLLCELLLSKGYRVAGVARRPVTLSSLGLVGQVEDRFQSITGDLGDPATVEAAIRDFQPDELYNLASQSSPALSWTLPVETARISALGAHLVFDAVRLLHPACRVFHASSSEVLGGAAGALLNETAPLAPTNPYAISKAFAQSMAQAYRQRYGLFISCGILFNHESPRRGMSFITQKVALGAACAACGLITSGERDELGEPVVSQGRIRLGNLDAARDWAFAGDIVEAMWLTLQHHEAGDFVLGTGHLHTVRDLCFAAYAAVGKDWREHVDTDPRFLRSADIARAADISKATFLLGWRPTTSFEQMVGDMVRSHVDRLSRYRDQRTST